MQLQCISPLQRCRRHIHLLVLAGHTTWRAGPVKNIRSDYNDFCKRVSVVALEFLCIEFMANIPLNFSPALLTNNLSALKNALSYCAVDQV